MEIGTSLSPRLSAKKTNAETERPGKPPKTAQAGRKKRTRSVPTKATISGKRSASRLTRMAETSHLTQQPPARHSRLPLATLALLLLQTGWDFSHSSIKGVFSFFSLKNTLFSGVFRALSTSLHRFMGYLTTSSGVGLAAFAICIRCFKLAEAESHILSVTAWGVLAFVKHGNGWMGWSTSSFVVSAHECVRTLYLY